MGPNDRSRNSQLATLGDIKMLAENIGQVENNHRQLVGNINEIVQWIRSIDQAAFISIHYHVNGNLEFNDETAQRTKDFIEQGRQAMNQYQVEQDARATKEAQDVMGNRFTVDGHVYGRAVTEIEQTSEHPAGQSTIYTKNGHPIPEAEYNFAVQQAYGLKKAADEKAELDKKTAANEAEQAPAEPTEPTQPDVAATNETKEPKDGDAGEKS